MSEPHLSSSPGTHAPDSGGHATNHTHDGGHDHADHHGGDSPWVDYNAKPPAQSTLPPLSAPVLVGMGIALAGVLFLIVLTSFDLARASHADTISEPHTPEKVH